MGHAGSDDLAASGPAGHEVRLHESGRNPEIGLDEPPVELHRRAPGRGESEVDVGRGVPRKVILDPR